MAGETARDREDVFTCRALSLALMHHGARRRIVEDIDLDVRRGEFLTIVGASGTGKTTLLRLLGGLVPASGGTISFRGRPVESPPEGVVVVFQDYSHALLQWRTVAGNVALGLEGTVATAESEQRVKTARSEER